MFNINSSDCNLLKDKDTPENVDLTEEQQEQLSMYNDLSQQFSVIPVYKETKIPIGEGWPRHCLEKRVFNEQDFIKRFPNGNITVLNAGVATGPASGVIVLDIDGQEEFENYCADNGIDLPLQDTFTVASGGKSLHYYYAYPQDGRKYGTRNFEGIFDILGIGAHAMAPGSIHPETKRPYTIKKDTQIAEAPTWLLDLALESKEKMPSQPANPADPNSVPAESDLISQGQRNVTLTKLAGKMRAAGMSYEGILAALEKENANRCSPPLGDAEVEKIAKSISKNPAGNASQFLLTELGNAERLISRYGNDLRYCPQEKKWYVWKGDRWEQRTGNGIIDLAKKTIREIYQESLKLQDLNEKNKLISHALRSESNFGLKAMVELAQSDPNIWVSPDEFDADPFKLNAQNGTIDLRTGYLYPHKREDLLRAMIPIEYDPHAQCPQFQRFMYGIMNSNMEMVGYLQKIIGYALTGDTSEQCYFIFYGEGSNGKSTLLNVIRALMGTFAKNMGFNTLTYSGDKARSDLARLVGARIVTCAEINRKKSVNEAVINRITGGDPVTVRFMYGDEFEYFPIYKLFIAGNDKPIIEGLKYGTWRRIRLIHFEVQFKQATGMIKNLEKQLLQELPGILNWAIEGCLNWQREGLEPPPPVKQATDGYRKETDVLKLFLDDTCAVDPKEFISSPMLYQSFVDWCHAEGYSVLGKVTFNRRLKKMGFQKMKKSGQENWYGIGELKETETETSPEALADEEVHVYENLL
jgi:putative DNA primase/helicase